ncbi:MAG: 50S ribosomal protein L32 [Elusimicrobia bacterium]|nr:50S ribosomal protein L32 [Elusimicrobiota bacterium]
MANPKKKHTPMRRDMRRSNNFRLEATTVSKCAQCGKGIVPHRVCPFCGYYRGELVLAPKTKKKDEGR